ncbi:hypothetical protein GGE45_002549 [Rhizobium aethiopicum]|uniref:Uncharacterized protein n=1 Tax=Rhizobium aethiopicum TaxID=1138170 RepID=A0A7W6MCS7_9HYPH|nr:hypothetical protein [Rhizobium aethiopicum]MBB4190042.1 hypothetical protein [Rhizobium aethiopicum]MBB4580219.1 hypothetical protein [Rhizobium aethiopicum]
MNRRRPSFTSFHRKLIRFMVRSVHKVVHRVDRRFHAVEALATELGAMIVHPDREFGAGGSWRNQVVRRGTPSIDEVSLAAAPNLYGVHAALAA